MIGSMMSMLGYWMVLFCLVIWMVVRLARSSGVWALLVFLFWPVSLLATLRFWGDRDSDIRMPFVLAVLTFGLTMYMADRVVDKAVVEAAPYFSDEELELIRNENPEMAAALERARAEAWEQWEAESGEPFDDAAARGYAPVERSARADSAARAAPKPARPAAAPALGEADAARVLDPAERELERQRELRRAAGALSFRFGTVAVGSAELTLPRGFRFLPRANTLRLAWLRGYRLADDSLGWVVHQDVDLAADDAWFVDVRWVGAGGTLMEQTLDGGMIKEGAHAPRRVESDVATWSVQHGEQALRVDAHAARAGRDGVLMFSVPGLPAAEAELGLRASRLLALRSRAARAPIDDPFAWLLADTAGAAASAAPSAR